MTVRTEEGIKTTKTPEDLQHNPVLTQKEI